MAGEKIAKAPTILLVDDEADILDILSIDLRELGAELLTSNTGNSAFEIVCNTHVDLVISDIKMPNGSGMDLLRMLRARDPISPRLLFISGHAQMKPEQATKLGASGIINKPWNRRELLKVIRDILETIQNS